MTALTARAVHEAICKLKRSNMPRNQKAFFTAGTGVPDDMAIDYYKESSIRVVTRDNRVFIKGKEVAEERSTP